MSAMSNKYLEYVSGVKTCNIHAQLNEVVEKRRFYTSR